MPYLHYVAHLLGLGRRGFAGLVRRLEQLIDRDMADLDGPARAAATEPGRLPPLLVIHDRDDREVGHADGRAYAESWPGATLLNTEGLGHRRLLTDPAVADAAVAFVTQVAAKDGPADDHHWRVVAGRANA